MSTNGQLAYCDTLDTISLPHAQLESCFGLSPLQLDGAVLPRILPIHKTFLKVKWYANDAEAFMMQRVFFPRLDVCKM